MSDHIRKQSDHGMPRGAVRAARLAFAIGALAAAVAGAQVPMVSLEDVLESGTDLVSLPAAPSGTISARECTGCPSYRVKFDPRTEYYVGRQKVSYANLLKTVGKNRTRLYIYFTPETRVLTRLRVDAPSGK